VVIVQHFPHSVKQYAKAETFPGRGFPIPDRCPHSECQADGSLIRWGTYWRWACTADGDYHIRVQRIRCKVCGRTHSLLPDFLHPHRHYAIRLLQHAVSLYVITGLGLGRLMEQLPDPGPALSTVREWLGSFAYGAGELLLDVVTRQLLALDPLAELLDTTPPQHLNRIPDSIKRRRLERAYRFWLLAEQLYAQVKVRQPRLHFTAAQLFPFLLHWLQTVRLSPSTTLRTGAHGEAQAISPRLFWSPALPHTPTTPF
jgi:hypothetical protein